MGDTEYDERLWGERVGGRCVIVGVGGGEGVVAPVNVLKLKENGGSGGGGGYEANSLAAAAKTFARTVTPGDWRSKSQCAADTVKPPKKNKLRYVAQARPARPRRVPPVAGG